ncbi:MAG: tRNA pseudouridine(54/55) synthase Pus10 [Desulfurococcaceae archaeon]|nr:tRNA pseudouridine(54/55) synthase Pus10 [Sulfolobales archaeon]MDW8169942.1 tRNA pseudouridine(54/55) synthase Pus10 [Desulfurococcaceae archaeon]
MNILDDAERILEKYPLCNHCLGRLYAKLGRGILNEIRGLSIKTLLAMEYHRRMQTMKKDYCSELRILAKNSGEPLTTLYRTLCIDEVSVERCFICKNTLSRELYKSIAQRVIEVLKRCDAKSFVIGVLLDPEVKASEIEVLSAASFKYSESIRNEVKREVGKLIRDLGNFTPDFTNPDLTAIVNLNGDIVAIVNQIYIYGVYWKRGRNISQSTWYKGEVKKYPYSIEEFFNERLKDLFAAEKIIIHASGREDVDARMLGTGRPLVIEVKNPLKRSVSLNELNEALKGTIVEALLHEKTSKKAVKLLKEGLAKKCKIYKALVLCDRELTDESLRELSEFFTDINVNQLTPARILGRKKEQLRRRKVYEVRAKLICGRIYEALIKAEGGLYVKELISGDRGRTNPSFTSFLNSLNTCIELDVIGVCDI